MAKSYIGVGDKAGAIKKIYIGIDGKARKVKKAYVGVNGVAKLVYQSEHNYVGTVTKAATCTSTGVITYTCSACGDSYTTTIEKLPHTEVTIAAVAATCTSTGLTAGKKCSVCNTVTVAQTTIPAKGHTPGAAATCQSTQTCTVCGVQLAAKNPNNHTSITTIAAVAATCTATGLTEGKKCTACGKVTVAQQTVAKKAHTPGAAATCTTPQKCTVCQTIIVAAKGHTDNNSDYVCDACGADLCTSATHTLVTLAAVAATCTSTGLTAGKQCSRCGEITVKQTVVAKNPNNHSGTTKVNGGTSGVHTKWKCCGATYQGSSYHSYTVDSGEQYQAATCTTNKKNYKKCSCGYNPKSSSYVVEIANTALGHNSDNNVDCTTDSVCTVCGEVLEEAWGHDPDSDADCTTDSVCTVCGEVLEEAWGHDWVSNNDYEAPTCTQTGHEESEYCGHCGKTRGGDTIPATGHTGGDTVEESGSEPGCTTYGYYDEVVYCVDCGTELERHSVPIDPTGHDPVSMPGEDATCTSDGYTSWEYCGTCGVVLESSETISAYGHSYFEGVCENCGESCPHDNMSGCCCDDCGEYVHNEVSYDDVDPTCTESGQTGGSYCSACGFEFEAPSTVPPTGHDWVGNDDYEEPTCTEAGHEESYYCGSCSATTGGDTIPATGHNWDEDPCICAWCGLEWHSFEDCVCTDCGEENHNWNGCVCDDCGAENHTYDMQECTCIDCGYHDDSYIDEDCYCSGCDEYFHQCTVYDCTCEHCGATDHVYGNSGDCIYGCGDHDDSYEGGGDDECLIASTPILMSDGTEKAISEVRAGDMVKSWDLDNNEYIDVKVLGAYCTGKATDWTVHTFDNGQSVTIYNNHRIFCKENNGVKGSEEWRAGLTALAVDGVETKYEDVETRHDETTSQRYTMLTENNLYFANGILCGHHSKSKYKFFTKGWLKATPEEIAHYATTASIYEDMEKAFTNEEYLKQAAPLREQLLKAKEAIRVHRHEIKKIDRDVKKRGRNRIAQKELFELDDRRNGRIVEARRMKANSKSLRRELDELKTKFGITTKSKYQIWKETYDIDMEYLKSKR